MWSYQWTSPPLQLSLLSQTCGLGLLETKIGAALCAIGVGGTLTLTLNGGRLHNVLAHERGANRRGDLKGNLG